MRIMSVVGARPQFVKLAPIDHAFRATGIDHIIVHTGQHYDPLLSDVFFDDLKISAPDVHLGVGSGSHGVQTGAILAGLDPVLEEYAPDWVLAYGDTNSTVAAALAASKLHIKVAHLEAGLRSFNRRMPEEINRILTDHASDLLLAPTEVAAAHLATEGLAQRTHIVGDVMTDVLMATAASSIENGDDPIRTTHGYDAGTYFLATIHRPDNTDDRIRLEAIIDSLSALKHPVILLAHPRLRAKATELDVSLTQPGIHLCDPLPYPQLVAAALHARGVITDSGGLQKEAFLLGVPTTTVRPETEWVETLEQGWNVLVEPGPELIQAALRQVPDTEPKQVYGDGKAAHHIAQLFLRFASHL